MPRTTSAFRVLRSSRPAGCAIAAGLAHVLLVAAVVRAQAPRVPLWTEVPVASAALGTTRSVYVVFPQVFTDSTKLPVLFLLDADDRQQFDAAIANFRFLAGRRALVPMLIVGIPNGATRTYDLTPRAAGGNSIGPTAATGGATQFAKFVVDELVPFIRQRYHTLSYAVLAGHSLGGLFTLDVLANRPGVFSAAIAMSPSLWWNDSSLVRPLGEKIAATKTPLRLFVGNGTLEPTIDGPTKSFVKVLQTRPSPLLSLRYRSYEDETHNMVPQAGWIDGLRFIFEPISLVGGPLARLDLRADSAQIVNAFRDVQATYEAGAKTIGLQPSLSDIFVRQFGQAVVGAYHQPGAAVVILRANVRQHPSSYLAKDALGDAMLAAGDSAAAREQFQAAAAQAKAAGDSISLAIQQKIERLRKR